MERRAIQKRGITVTAEEAIAAYNQELRKKEGWYVNFTIEDLIKQSRKYRDYNMEFGNGYRAGHSEGFSKGYADGKKALADEAITLTELRFMTIQQIIDLLYEE